MKFLLEKGSDPHMLSYVDNHEKESIIEVCGRWSHTNILEYLLMEVDWSQREINLAIKNE